jgi:hypothetical protein
LTSACKESCGDPTHPAAKAGRKKIQNAVKEISVEEEAKNTGICRNGSDGCNRTLFLKKHEESEIGINTRFTPGLRTNKNDEGQSKPYLGTPTFTK